MTADIVQFVSEKPKRQPLSKRVRFEVFKRDGFACQYCGATPPGVLLHCDHIHPVAEGGSNDMDNLVTACEACNQGKSDVLLSEVPQSLQARALEVAEREAQIAGYEAIMRERRQRLANDADEVLGAFCEFYNRDGIPWKDFASIKRFVDQLGLDAVLSAAEIGNAKFPYSYKRGFLYFCGICWRKIRRAEGSEE